MDPTLRWAVVCRRWTEVPRTRALKPQDMKVPIDVGRLLHRNQGSLPLRPGALVREVRAAPEALAVPGSALHGGSGHAELGVVCRAARGSRLSRLANLLAEDGRDRRDLLQVARTVRRGVDVLDANNRGLGPGLFLRPRGRVMARGKEPTG